MTSYTMINYTMTLSIILFIFGACIGSFLNVCIFRIPLKKSIVFPASFCPECKKNIPYFCNIPILSYIFLQGQCKYCKTHISLRYPLVELLTAVFTVFLFLNFNLTFPMFFWLSFVCVLIVVSFIDFDHQIIPDVISIPGMVIFASSAFFLPEMSIKDVLMGIFAGGGILYIVALVYFKLRKKQGMGGGDIKLLAMIGAAMGIKGVMFTLFFGSLFGTAAGIFSIFLAKAGERHFKIPFGPYLSAGAVLYIFYGSQMIQWYIHRLAY